MDERKQEIFGRRSWRRKPRPVTPEMLVMCLKSLHKSKIFGMYFDPAQVTQVVAQKYSWVQEDPNLLYQEVKDKLLCAAAADIIGFKIDSGYHVLTSRGRCVRIDTRSELTFWMLFKKLIEERRLKNANKTPLSRKRVNRRVE